MAGRQAIRQHLQAGRLSGKTGTQAGHYARLAGGQAIRQDWQAGKLRQDQQMCRLSGRLEVGRCGQAAAYFFVFFIGLFGVFFPTRGVPPR